MNLQEFLLASQFQQTMTDIFTEVEGRPSWEQFPPHLHHEIEEELRKEAFSCFDFHLFGKAEKIFCWLVEKAPENVLYWRGLADSQFHNSRYTSALESYRHLESIGWLDEIGSLRICECLWFEKNMEGFRKEVFSLSIENIPEQKRPWFQNLQKTAATIS